MFVYLIKQILYVVILSVIHDFIWFHGDLIFLFKKY